MSTSTPQENWVELVDVIGESAAGAGPTVSRGAAALRVADGVARVARLHLLDAERDAARLWQQVCDQCATPRVEYSVSRDDEAAAAVHAVADGTLLTTRMDKPLHQSPGDTGIELIPMTAEQFDPWHRRQQEEYARTRAANGDSTELAERIAREQHAQLFPDGVNSPHQQVFTAHHTAGGDVRGVIGALWLDDSAPEVFIYQVEIEPQFRGRGWGRAVMLEAERWCLAHNRTRLVLNVFGDNTRARALYDNLGYTPIISAYGVDLRG